MIVETNHVCRDEIEFFSKIRQGNKFPNAPHDAFHAEQRDRLVEHRHIVNIQTDGIVTEQFADMEKIPAARADIENAATSAKIEFQIVNSLEVGVQPCVQVEIFGRGVARICDTISSPNFLKLFAIDCLDDCVGIEISRRAFLEQGSPKPVQEALGGCTGKNFSDFMRKAHEEMSRFVIRGSAGVNNGSA